LWELCRDWSNSKNVWENAVLKTLVPDEVEKEHKRMRTAVMRLCVGFEQAKTSNSKPGGPLQVAKSIQSEIEAFRKNLPVIRSLCVEGLKERHTAKILKLLAIN
jgi:hypothetical protein